MLTPVQETFLRRHLGIDIGFAGSEQDILTEVGPQGFADAMRLSQAANRIGVALDAFNAARRELSTEIPRVVDAIRAVYAADPDTSAAVSSATQKLTALSGRFDGRLDSLVAEFVKAQPVARAEKVPPLSDAIAALIRQCESDPLAAAFDGNEFVPGSTPVANMRSALEKMFALLPT